MGKMTDQQYLVTSQYRTEENLLARSELHRKYTTHPIPWFQWVYDHLQIPRHALILEVGCGTGELWVANKERIQPGWCFVFTDLSRGMLLNAKKNLAFLAERSEFKVSDVQLMSFESHSFDVVIANHMLYHAPNIQRAIIEIHRVLKPGGRLYAATNGLDHMREMVEFLEDIPARSNLFTQWASILRHVVYSFNIENGFGILSQEFSKVKLHNYQDSLRVTDAKAIVDYLVSLTPESSSSLSDHVLDHLRAEVTLYMERLGGIFQITKSTGMFECWKQE